MRAIPRVESGTLQYVYENHGSFTLQVRGDDRRAAVRALESAAEAIARLPSTVEPGDGAASYISEVFDLPDGPILTIDMTGEPRSTLHRAVEVVRQHLDEAGAADALLGPPRTYEGPWAKLAPRQWWESERDAFPRAPDLLALRARRDPAEPLPDTWIQVALDWVADETAGRDLWGRIGGLEVPLATNDARGWLARGGVWTGGLVSGDERNGFRSVEIATGVSLRVVLSELHRDGAAGPELAERLKVIGRALAQDADYVALDLTTDAPDRYWGVRHLAHWSEHYPRERVPGVFAWQILSPEHVERCAGAARGIALPSGQVELSIGTTEDWQSGLRRWRRQRSRGARMLRQCLSDDRPQHEET